MKNLILAASAILLAGSSFALTANRVVKASSGTYITDSQIRDDGTGVAIGTEPVSGQKLAVNGNIYISSGILRAPSGTPINVQNFAINSSSVPTGSLIDVTDNNAYFNNTPLIFANGDVGPPFNTTGPFGAISGRTGPSVLENWLSRTQGLGIVHRANGHIFETFKAGALNWGLVIASGTQVAVGDPSAGPGRELFYPNAQFVVNGNAAVGINYSQYNSTPVPTNGLSVEGSINSGANIYAVGEVSASSFTVRRKIFSATGAAPSASSCGSSPSISGNDTAFLVTVGTGDPNSCALNFNGTWGSSPPVCTFTSSDASSSALSITSLSATAITLDWPDASDLSSDKLYVICIGN